MSSTINLGNIYFTNLFGIILIFTLFFTNQYTSHSESDNKYVKVMMWTALISCIVDPICLTCDGRPGLLNFLGVYLGNVWLYAANLICFPFWVLYLFNQMGVMVNRFQKGLLTSLCSIGATTLVVNFFYPIVFDVVDNVYIRKPFFWIYMLIMVILMLDSVIVYLKVRITGGKMKFFHIWLFLFPITLGMILQGMYYGISVIWPFASISICALTNATKNQVVFKDELTGLYNRYYLDFIKKKLEKGNHSQVAAMMMDMNGFKKINDDFGHGVGDEALKTVSNILQETVGPLGTVIRYAGDEFVVLLNSVEPEIVEGCVKAIHRNIEKSNEKKGYRYILSLSIGYGYFDFKQQSIDEVLNEIDWKMYKSKAEYYQNNAVDRRKHI